MTSAAASTLPAPAVAPAGAVRSSALDPRIAGRLKRDRDGLVVAVAQQLGTGQVLMVGWMDDEALHRTLTTGRCTYWSRSRQEYWVKGETSGAQQWVQAVALDCDGDSLLVTVDQVGGACHTGDRTCFDVQQFAVVVGQAPAGGQKPAGAATPDPAPPTVPSSPAVPAPAPAATPDPAAPAGPQAPAEQPAEQPADQPTPAADPDAASPS